MFNAQLLDFQREDVEKFVQEPNILNCNEMGLGKTFEALAVNYVRRRTSNKPTLVICPMSVIGSWHKHITEITGCSVKVINPKNREWFLQGDKHDFYVMHWDALRLMPELKNFGWLEVIADEAHRAKNRKAKQTKALKQIKCDFKQALTGTPIDHQTADAWSILNWLYPKEYTSYWRFFKTYSNWTKSDEWGNPTNYMIWLGPKNTDEFLEAINPFYVRHLKIDHCHDNHPQGVLKNFPSKYYSTIYTELGAKQRKHYDSMRDDMLAWVDGYEGDDETPLPAPMTISRFSRLRQFAVSDCKLDTDTVAMTEPSAKLDALMEWISDHPDEPVVVFSFFAQVIKLLQSRCAAKGIAFDKIVGDVSQARREAAIEEFQDGNINVLGITMASGGSGITLTHGNTAIFLDRAPSHLLNTQSEDRLWRIGQKRNVHIIDIVATDTIDEAQLERKDMKKSWVKEILGA